MHQIDVTRPQMLRTQPNRRLGASRLEQADPGRFHAVGDGRSFIVATEDDIGRLARRKHDTNPSQQIAQPVEKTHVARLDHRLDFVD